MASCQILWKNMWESRGIGGGKAVEKAVNKPKNEYFGCSVWWKSVRFCELLFGFREKSGWVSGKNRQRSLGIVFTISTIST